MKHRKIAQTATSTIIAIAAIMVSFLAIMSERKNPSDYADLYYPIYCLILIILSLLPCLVFSLKNKANLIIGSGFPLLAIIVHNALHYGYNTDLYTTLGFSPHYHLHHIVSILTMALTVGIYTFRHTLKKRENTYNLLEEQFNKIQTSTSAILQENKGLNKQSGELRQFLYTVSHNIKGPIANLKGLLNLLQQDQMTPENIQIINKLNKTVSTMNNDIKDLAYIIDVQNKAMQIYQRICLHEETDQICTLLVKKINDSGATVKVNCDKTMLIYSIRPMLKSILFNLISNSIKYKPPQRAVTIQVRASWAEKNTACIEIEDNGLGMKLSQERKKQLFEPYTRFSNMPHIEGRGIGLFLVKSQVDVLHGTIDVESEQNKGTCFRILLPIPTNIERQTLIENSIYILYFDALLNCLKTTWKKDPSPDEFTEIVQRVVELATVYKAVAWITTLPYPIEQYLTLSCKEHEEHEENKCHHFTMGSSLRQLILLTPEQKHSNGEGHEQQNTKQIKKRLAKWLDLEVHCFSSEAKAENHIKEIDKIIMS